MAYEIPLCFGSEQHSNTSLICKRCPFEYKCYMALRKKLLEKKNGTKTKDWIFYAVVSMEHCNGKLCNHIHDFCGGLHFAGQVSDDTHKPLRRSQPWTFPALLRSSQHNIYDMQGNKRWWKQENNWWSGLMLCSERNITGAD